MTTILTYGTYDLFHYGHMNLLRRARALGTRLLVGLSTDEFNSIKGKRAFHTYEERAEILNACRYVDHVFPECNWQQKTPDILRYQASVLVMGDDWAGKFDEFSKYCRVQYLERTPLISSTLLRNNVRQSRATTG